MLIYGLFLLFVFGLLALDLGVFHKSHKEVTMKESLNLDRNLGAAGGFIRGSRLLDLHPLDCNRTSSKRLPRIKPPADPDSGP